MRKRLSLIISIFIISIFISSQSNAITIGFEPISQDVPLGTQAIVNIFISGLGDGTAPSLSTFDLDISFDPTILAFSTAVFGDPILGDQLDIWGLGGNSQSFSIVSPGVLNIYEVSLDWPWDLEDYQAGSFVLASLTFDTLALGTSPLDIFINALGDAYGNPLTADIQGGNVNVVPEPATIVLISIGLASLVGTRWFREKYL